MFYFHTPKLPDPLDLDLAELQGGGACPSQFYGQTHDLREVYVRYRYGTLRVYVADYPTDEAYPDGRCVLEIDIGTDFDGRISLKQFCESFGVTINGSIPTETDPDAHRNADFSGETTYWRPHLRQVTDATSRRIVQACRDALSDALILQEVRDDRFRLDSFLKVDATAIEGYSVWIIEGALDPDDVKISPEKELIPDWSQLRISAHCMLWKWPKPIYTHHQRDKASRDLGRTLIVAGDVDQPPDIELAHNSLNLSCAFKTEDEGKRAKLETISNRISAFLPVTALERVDLASGQVLTVLNRPLDPVIAEWCVAGPDRWLAVLRDTPTSPWVGVRPSRT
ncbi:MAG: hypothetical protein AAF479_04425 [Pseudomonadota bacterium]